MPVDDFLSDEQLAYLRRRTINYPWNGDGYVTVTIQQLKAMVKEIDAHRAKEQE